MWNLNNEIPQMPGFITRCESQPGLFSEAPCHLALQEQPPNSARTTAMSL